MDYFAYLHKLIRRDNVPFWNRPHQPRTAGRLLVVPLFSFAWRKRRGEDGNGNRRRRIGEDFERMEEESGRTGTGLRRSGTGIGEEWNGTLKRKKKGL